MRSFYKTFIAVYEGDETPPPVVPPPVVPPVDDKTPKFSQEQLNKILADDRRKHQTQVKETVTQLEELKKQKGLSEQAQQELEQRIDALNSSLLTEKEKATHEIKKKEAEFTTLLTGTQKEKEDWKRRYSEETTKNQILVAAGKHGALSEEQMLDYLLPKTRLTEVLSEDGKTILGYLPKIKFRVKDDTTGEEKELDLTIEDTVKRMKETPDRFGNLFKSGTTGGLGGTGSSGQVGGGSEASLERLLKDPAAYRAAREKLGLKRGKK